MTEEHEQRLSPSDKRWLLGAEFARLDSKTARMTARSSRWLHAVNCLPSPAAVSASQHVVLTYYTRIRPRLEKEGWNGYAKSLPKQEVWWYQAAAVLLAQGYAESHVETCHVCTSEDWGWLLSVPVRTPHGVDFDLEGNTKT